MSVHAYDFIQRAFVYWGDISGYHGRERERERKERLPRIK